MSFVFPFFLLKVGGLENGSQISERVERRFGSFRGCRRLLLSPFVRLGVYPPEAVLGLKGTKKRF